MKYIIKKQIEARNIADALKKEEQAEVIDVFKLEELPPPEPIGFTK